MGGVNTSSQWKPNVTVAAVIERDGRFLFVEEETAAGVRLNQPAGHLERGESLLAACVRETLEESAWHFAPRELVGIYLWPADGTDITYLRFAFCGELQRHDSERRLDAGILRALWLTPEELQARRGEHRSPLVAQCVADYLAGQRLPLAALRDYA